MNTQGVYLTPQACRYVLVTLEAEERRMLNLLELGELNEDAVADLSNDLGYIQAIKNALKRGC